MLKLLFHKRMNRLYLLMSFAVLFSCKSPSQENANKDISEKVTTLTTSLENKEESAFLNSFPKDFTSFKNTFGWDDEKDTAKPLYNNANKYIDYLFSLIKQPKYNKYESQIIDISKGGIWQADAVAYFQNSAVKYIKENKRYHLINSLSDNDAKSVLSFLFDSGSGFKKDSDFISNLNKEKQQLANSFLSANISSEKKRGSFETYENNKNYFIKTFDVNKDGIPDKLVSSTAYQGEDLFVFLGNKAGSYDLNLETTNFSEDGGNIIRDITPIANSKGFTVKTYFPDRGFYEKEFNIIPENNTWILRNTIYKTMSDVSENALKYICDVSQNIDITKSGWSDRLNSIPEENERSKKCRVEKVSENGKQYLIQDPDGYTNLRKEKNTSSQVLQKINSGENVEVLDNSGDWYLVKTRQGTKGYVHKSRITSAH